MKLTSLLITATVCSAATTKKLLFVEELQTSGSYEIDVAKALNIESETISVKQWQRMKTRDFASYKAIIINDPGYSLVGDDVESIQFLEDTSKVWGPAVKGNIVIAGTDTSNHYGSGRDLIVNSIRFAANDKDTGLYLSLSRYYHYDETATVGALSYFGNFTVRGNLECYDNVHVVASSPAIQNLTDSALSDWTCSVHEAFAAYPSTGKDGFQGLAIADGVTGVGTQNYAEGHFGLPYIISRGATPNGCGDGHWDESIGEECDDGNIKDGDGCSRSCRCESGFPKGDGTCFPATDTDGLLMMPEPYSQLGPAVFFTSTYMIVIITVLFKTLWGIVVASSRMIEPFYQLHKPAGASAKESLLSDYLSSGVVKETMKNIFRGHWIMTLTTAVFAAANISMLIASEAMTIRSGNYCETPDEPLKCDLQWVIDTRIARALQAFMAISMIAIILRIILGWKRESGVSSYPCTIASMATLLNNPAVMNSFQHIEPDATTEDLATALSENYYSIRYYEASPGVFRYGLTQIAAPPKRSWISSLKVSTGPPWFTKTERKPNAKRPWYRENMFLGFLLVVHMILLIIFLYYRLSRNGSIFVNKKRFGMRFLLTLVCFYLSVQWTALEAEVRIMTPYRKLSKPKSNSQQILDMPLHGVPLTALPRALWYGHWYHALVAAVAILSQALLIAVGGIPYNFGVIQNVSLFSSTACIGILGIMVTTLLSVVWWRHTNPEMARKPDTIANMTMMLCTSQIIQHFDGVSHDSARKKDLEDAVRGKQFHLGKQIGADGKDRVVVNVVEVPPEVSDSDQDAKQEADRAAKS